MQNINPRLTKNNFDLLRLVLSGIVCLVHSYELSGFRELSWITRFFSSAVAVKSFFVVSGFLVFMSYERSISLASYAKKRIRRIYPAYFTIIMICAIGATGISSKGIVDYFSLEWLKYIAANLTFMNFLHPDLPGVFGTNKLNAVNGALWTLKIEVMFYFSVPLIGLLCKKYSHLPLLIFIYAASAAYAGLLTMAAERTGSGIYIELARQLPGQLSYFMAGAAIFFFLDSFERHVRYYLPAAMTILAVNLVFPLPLLEPVALATVVAFFGLFLYVGNFGKYGDFSYGFYIIHFPIIQLMIYSGWFSEDPWYFLITVILATLAGSFAMWHVIEKRFLFRNSHYISNTSGTHRHLTNTLKQENLVESAG